MNARLDNWLDCSPLAAEFAAPAAYKKAATIFPGLIDNAWEEQLQLGLIEVS